MATLNRRIDENNEKLLTQIREMLAERDPLQGVTEPEPAKPRNLEERVARLEKQMGNHGTALGQIAMQDETGGYHVRFDTNSQTARSEVKRAIESTVPEYGKLTICNKTNHDEWIVINGEQRLVLAGSTLRPSRKAGHRYIAFAARATTDDDTPGIPQILSDCPSGRPADDSIWMGV